MHEIDPDGPYCVQMTDLPAFRSRNETGKSLVCRNLTCGHILFENYVEGTLVDIGIKCFRCQTITRTKGIDPGEIFPSRIVTLPNDAVAMISSTIDIDPGSVYASSQESVRELEACSPRKSSISVSATWEGYEYISGIYNSLTNNKLQSQQASIARGQRASELPFAWAMIKFKDRLKHGFPLVDPDMQQAWTWFVMFTTVVSAWNHHPRFGKISKDLGKPNSFIHTASQLILALIMFDAGNRIGLALEDRPGEPNPDLYVRLHGRKVYLEVKAPGLFQNRAEFITRDAALKAVAKKLKSSRDQINETRPGALVLCSTSSEDKNRGIFLESLDGAFSKDSRRWMAALIGFSISSQLTHVINGMSVNLVTQFRHEINPNYEGLNPFVILET